MKRRILSMVLALCLLAGYLPVTARAETECHPVHTGECGYAEAVEGVACNHQHSETCGYKAEIPEVTCSCTDTDEDGQIDHVDGCGYQDKVEGAPCNHVCTDGTCTYVAAVEAAPCTHVCAACTPCICDVQCNETINNDCPLCSATAGGDCEAAPADEPAACICDSLCTEDAVNNQCPVCMESLDSCAGTPETEAPATALDNVKALVAALPETVAAPEELAAQAEAVAAARAAYESLTGEEKAQLDVTRLTALENLLALQAQVDALPDVDPAEKTLEELTALKKDLNALRDAVNASPAIHAQKLTDQLGAVNDKMLQDIQSRIDALPNEEALKKMTLEELKILYNGDLLTISSAMEVADATETLNLEKLMQTAALINELIMTLPEGVAKIGEITYQTLDEAVAAAADGDTIELLKDCTTVGFVLDKNLTISGGGRKINFTERGFVLKKNLTFDNCQVTMTGIGESSELEKDWSWQSICVTRGANLSLIKGTEMRMDGTGTPSGPSGGKQPRTHAIYLCGNNVINITNSKLYISNYSEDAIEWDGDKNGTYTINLTDAYFESRNNRQGITGTMMINCIKSTLIVDDSTASGSNGSHFDIRDSVVHFDNNGSHGLSAGWCRINHSTVTAIGNGGNGIHTGQNLVIENGSEVTVSENGCTISSQWTIPGAVYIGANGQNENIGTISKFSDSTVTITENRGSGIYQKGGDLVIDRGTVCSITYNAAEKLGIGGGLNAHGTSVSFPNELAMHNNHACIHGDDVYIAEGTSMHLEPASKGIRLDQTVDTNDCRKRIDGWYDDSANVGEGDDAQYNRWNSHDREKIHVKLMPSGDMTGPVSLKAAHDILVDVHLTKWDAKNGKPLAGAEFKDDQGNTMISDEHGELHFKNLVLTPTTVDGVTSYDTRTVTIRETKAPAGFQLIPGKIKFAVSKGKPNFTPTSDDYEVRDGEVVVQIRTKDQGLSVSAKSGFVKNEEGGKFLLLDKVGIKIPVKKIWNDDDDLHKMRPDSVTVYLYNGTRDPIQTLVLNRDNNWAGVFEGLNEYDENGEPIEYAISEKSIENYIGVIDGNVKDGFVITNTLHVEDLDIPVEKIWKDSHDSRGKRPDSVTIYLYADGKYTGKKLLLKEKNDWEGVFQDLPIYKDGEEIQYTIREKDVPQYHERIKGDADKGFTVTNYYESSAMSPFTGDNIMTAVTVLILSAAGLAAVLALNSKKRRNSQ